MLRQLGSTVHRLTEPRTAPQRVDQKIATEAVERIVSSQTTILSYITAALEEQYPDEFEMLKMLAGAELFNFRQLAALYPNELSHLIGYGLLPAGVDSETISISLLQAYLQARASTAQQGKRVEPAVALGEGIGERQIVTLLKSGGFADVFLAEDNQGERSAIKVFRGAQMSALEREVEYLQMFDHPGIVRFLEAAQTLDGKPCLIMEYLEGRPLSERCNAASAPNTGELVTIASNVLDTLVYMHPDTKGADALSKKEEMTAEEFQEWERLRLGVVHRDIKPENIILTPRGPVLIDFNISVRAAAPVLTMSSTRGYLPPDFNGVSWTPDVDIYQLGVTLSQLAAGAAYTGDNVSDLLALSERRHGKELSGWLSLLVSDSQRPSAAELAARLRTIRGNLR